jgi:hypothetical protein
MHIVKLRKCRPAKTGLYNNLCNISFDAIIPNFSECPIVLFLGVN